MIRQNVPGIRGSIAATRDGLLIAYDLHDLEPSGIAALVAALHAVAARASLSTGGGQLKEVVSRSTEGYLAVYAAGSAALVAVLGTNDMNVAMLNHQARRMIERIAEHSGRLVKSPPPGPSAPSSPTDGAAGSHDSG